MLNLREGEYLGQNLKSIENSLFRFSITSYRPYSILEKHYHQNNYLSLLIEGNYLERNSSDESFIIAGDILFRPSAYTHENIFKSNSGRCFNIEFKSGWNKDADANLKIPDSFKHFKSGNFPPLYKLFTNFQRQYSEDLSSELIFDWIFQVNRSTISAGHQPWIKKVQTIIKDEIEVFHSLQSLSERVFVHPVHLSRAFKEKTGFTISVYQLKIKLSNSISLLFNTSLSISDISYRNGFYDEAHFIRSFQAIYKISPQKFRLLVKS